MGVDREELKRLIDQMPEQDALQVHNFIEYLGVERENDNQHQLDTSFLEEDADLIRQVEHSRGDRKLGRVYGKEAGLEYLRDKVKDFEHGQNI